MKNFKFLILFLVVSVLVSCSSNQNTKTTEPNGTEMVENILDKPSLLIQKLSLNGIGQLSEWKNPFDMGWGSLTPYFQFGSVKQGKGISNNISYYLEGTEKECTKISIILNINNPEEKSDGLNFLNELTLKTFETLEYKKDDDLHKNILKPKEYKSDKEDYKVYLTNEKTKIDSWKMTIERK